MSEFINNNGVLFSVIKNTSSKHITMIVIRANFAALRI